MGCNLRGDFTRYSADGNWTIDHARWYMKGGRQTDAVYSEVLFDDFDFGMEFLMRIIEYLDDEKRHAVRLHKITKVWLN